MTHAYLVRALLYVLLSLIYLQICASNQYLVIGAKSGMIQINQRTAGTGDTLRLTDKLTISTTPESYVWLYTSEGKTAKFSTAGIYTFAQLESIIRVQPTSNQLLRFWLAVKQYATEHENEETANNMIGSTNKQVSFTVQDNFLLLTDSIVFEWTSITKTPVQFILADTVLFDAQTGTATYYNAVYDTVVAGSSFVVNFTEKNLPHGRTYYWCVNSPDDVYKQFIFFKLLYVLPQQRTEIQAVLTELSALPQGNDLKILFQRSFFVP